MPHITGLPSFAFTCRLLYVLSILPPTNPLRPLCCPPSAGLCITTVVSYLSHSQVWAVQAGSGVMVGGTTNRAKIFFEQELGEILGSVPEVLPAAPELVGGNGSGGGQQQQQR